jgi:hypothetical protein
MDGLGRTGPRLRIFGLNKRGKHSIESIGTTPAGTLVLQSVLHSLWLLSGKLVSASFTAPGECE